MDSLDKVVSFKDFELAQDESTVKKIETETVKSADKPKETNEAITGSPGRKFDEFR